MQRRLSCQLCSLTLHGRIVLCRIFCTAANLCDLPTDLCWQVVCMTLYKPSKLELWWVDAGRSRGLPAAFLFTDSTSTLQVSDPGMIPKQTYMPGLAILFSWGMFCSSQQAKH